MSSWKYILAWWFLRALSLSADVPVAPGNEDLFFDEEFSVYPYFLVTSRADTAGRGNLMLSWTYNLQLLSKTEPSYDKPTVRIFNGRGKKLLTLKPKKVGTRRYLLEFPDLCKYPYPLYYHLDGISGRRRIPRIGCKSDEISKVSFWLASDFHLKKKDELFLKEMAHRLNQRPADFLLIAGDIVDARCRAPEAVWEDMLEKFGLVWDHSTLVASVGNHDQNCPRNERVGWQTFLGSNFKDAYYSFVQGPARFIVLNSNVGDDKLLLDAQIKWLGKILDQSESPFTVFLSHHPPASGMFYDEALESVKTLKAETVILAESILPLLWNRTSKMIWLAGDVHFNQRLKLDCASLITVGAMGERYGKQPERHLPHPRQVHSSGGQVLLRFEITETEASAVGYDVWDNILIPEFSLPLIGRLPAR